MPRDERLVQPGAGTSRVGLARPLGVLLLAVLLLQACAPPDCSWAIPNDCAGSCRAAYESRGNCTSYEWAQNRTILNGTIVPGACACKLNC